jgi:hypothetical protein
VDVFAACDRVIDQCAKYVRNSFTIRDTETRRFVDGDVDGGVRFNSWRDELLRHLPELRASEPDSPL